MSTTITNIPINGISDKRLTLATSAWAAGLNFSSDWRSILVGYRFCMADTGVNLTTTARLYVGLLANPNVGLTNSPLTTATSHFIGATTVSATWTRGISDSLVDYDIGSTATAAIVRSGSLQRIVSLGTNGVPFRSIVAQPANGGRIAGILNIAKGIDTATGSVFTVSGTYHSSGDADLYDVDLWRALENDPDSAAYLNGQGLNYTIGGSAGVPANEPGSGYFNSVCIAWNHSTPVMYFSDVAVMKIN